MSTFQSHLAGFKAGLRAILPPAPVPRGTLPLDIAATRILPKVRPRFAYEVFGLRNAARKPESKPLGGSFSQSLVVDFPEGEIEVTTAHLQAWGRDFDEMMNLARTNLLARGSEERFERSRHGFYRSTWDDALDGSRILLPGVLKRLRLDGDPVVFLPHRGALLVAGSEDPDGLCRALEGALELQAASAQPMNACPLRLVGFGWEALTLPPGHPARSLLAKAHRQRLHLEYGQQKILLDAQHQREGRRIEVAPFKVVAGPSGRIASATHWTGEMQGALLPEAERICLSWNHGAGPKNLWLHWDLVKRRLEPFLEPLGLFPERHRIRAFPGLDLLEDLAALSESPGLAEPA